MRLFLPFVTPLRALFQGNPFDGFPYGLRAAKHHAALRLSLRSRFKQRSPLKIPLRENYPFLVLYVECSNDSTRPLCAAPSRGVLCGSGTYSFMLNFRQNTELCFFAHKQLVLYYYLNIGFKLKGGCLWVKQ